MKNPLRSKLADLNEEDLRRNVLIPILERTSGVSRVTDVHGINERGLDIVFFTQDAIRITCYGLQLKAGDISGGGSRGETVKTIIDQLELAADFKHPIAAQPRGEYVVERFIVATNGRISATAREEIARRTRPTPVDFWDLSDIIRRANDVYPELLQTGDAELVEYLRHTLTRAQTLDALDQISGVVSRQLSDVFVEPHLRRRLDPSLGAEPSLSSSTDHSHNLPALNLGDEDGCSVIIGEQNDGKTAILRMMAIGNAENILGGSSEDDDPPRIPVSLRASAIIDAGSLAGAVSTHLSNLGAADRSATIATSSDLSPYLVLVDGFSELPTADDKKRCAAILEPLAKLSDVKTIVAARPEDFLRPGFFDDFRQYTIQGFKPAQVQSLIRKWTAGSIEFEDVAEKMVERIRDALQLPGSPIPAIIGVMLYEKENKFITNTAEAVNRYMVIRLGRYSHEMGVRMQVEWQRKQDLLAEVAFHMVEHGLDAIETDTALSLMDAVYTRLGEDSKSRVAVEELVAAGVLDSQGEELCFYRTGFRDFFAGTHIFNNSDSFEDFIAGHLFDPEWGRAIVFAAGLRRHNSDLLERLTTLVKQTAEQLSTVSTEDYLYGGYILGRVLSNSDAAGADARIAALRCTISAGRESAALLADEAEDLFGNLGKVLALVGTEQTMLVTVGVPWLEQQFRTLAVDPALSEEERYLVCSIYANLACENWMPLLKETISVSRSPRVVTALLILTHLLDGERDLDGSDGAEWKEIKLAMERKTQKYSRQVSEMLELRSPLLDLERKRLHRLQRKEEHQ